ncbi:aspartyl-phosphate phosphatase Spo0E family protein [Peptoclostridium litorale]|nr:aspartyl-phosphate phosphatase Spo0E family protein [Peptoclostridium litorale]
MENEDLREVKEEIEQLREDINRYIQYPDIFKDEIQKASKKIDSLINDYIRFSSAPK